jgi:hypothetical protein
VPFRHPGNKKLLALSGSFAPPSRMITVGLNTTTLFFMFPLLFIGRSGKLRNVLKVLTPR